MCVHSIYKQFKSSSCIILHIYLVYIDQVQFTKLVRFKKTHDMNLYMVKFVHSNLFYVFGNISLRGIIGKPQSTFCLHNYYQDNKLTVFFKHFSTQNMQTLYIRIQRNLNSMWLKHIFILNIFYQILKFSSIFGSNFISEMVKFCG